MQISDSHKKRIISGLLMVAVLITCLITGGWPFRIFVTLAALLALWEFYQMFWPGFTARADKAVGYIAGLGVCMAGSFGLANVWMLAVLGLAACYAVLSFLFSYGRGNDTAHLGDKGVLLLGVMYLPLAMQLILHLSLTEQIIIFLAAVASDTGAYYAGSYLGKHKMWPRVSPKKSWEGSIGGMGATMIVLAVYSCIVEIPQLENVAFWQWGLIGIMLSIAAQIGDFFESALKRSVNVKDSSNLIPGHGGVMDRLDSIVFVLSLYMFIRLLYLSL